MARRRNPRGLLIAAAVLVSLSGAYGVAADRPIPVLNGRVVSVISGDTINVKLTNGVVRVVLQGVDAPEKDQLGGEEAAVGLAKLVNARDVRIAIVDQRPRQNISIAVVYVGDTDVNEAMVRDGLAWADRRHMRRKDDAILCIYEEEARGLGRGLWAYSKLERIAPWEWRNRFQRNYFTDYTDETAANCLAAVGEGKATDKAQ
ncbi:MAG: thermonuclease family protein [Steroidobacterales bacterium]